MHRLIIRKAYNNKLENDEMKKIDQISALEKEVSQLREYIKTQADKIEEMYEEKQKLTNKLLNTLEKEQKYQD